MFPVEIHPPHLWLPCWGDNHAAGGINQWNTSLFDVLFLYVPPASKLRDFIQ